MNPIIPTQNSYINIASPLNKQLQVFACILAVTTIAIAAIGLTASTAGPFNAIVGLGSTTHGILLGTSIFVLILDLVWIATLSKQKKTLSDSFQEEVPVFRTFDERLDAISLPIEVSMAIFSYLDANDLERSCMVSTQWCSLASDPILWDAHLRNLSPSLRVFDELDWMTHVDVSSLGLSIGDAPPSDKRKAFPILKRLLPSLSIEGNSGITLLTIPEGLTFNKLVKLAGSPKLGNAFNFQSIWNHSTDPDIPVDKTYSIVITNNVLTGTRGLSVSDQKNLIGKFGCEIPKALEAATLLVITCISSQQRLSSPWVYSGDDYQLIAHPATTVGGYCFGGVGGVLRKF